MEPESVPEMDGSSSGRHRGASRTSWPQIVVAAGVLLYFSNAAELVLVVLLVSILLTFILAPIVEFLERLTLPRALASLVAVLLLVALLSGISYLSYNQAATLVKNLPQYSVEMRQAIARLREKAEHIENRIEGNPEPTLQSPQPNNQPLFNAHTNWTDLLTRGFGSFTQALFAASFVPFLVYFMLSWQQHVRSATVMLFRLEDRHTAYVTLGLIAQMMRRFMVGNFLVGLFMSSVSTVVFFALHLPFFYFLGPISGFLSLVPYLGVLLALVPPLMVGMGQIQSTDAFLIILTVLLLHLVSLNLLYPKFLGNRLQLNPLAVTISLLFWGWLWGAMGLVLAIPLTGALKIVFDHIEPWKPYGVWLGE